MAQHIVPPLWELPYPEEEHDMRVMCGDPIATLKHDVEFFLRGLKLNPSTSFEEIMASAVSYLTMNYMSSFSVVRNSYTFPEDLPNQLWERMADIIKELYYVRPEEPENGS